MATRDMSKWETSISQVIGTEGEDKIIVRGHDLNDLIDDVSLAGMMFVMLQGRKPSAAETRVLDALLVASVEHGIAPPSMIARCYASYGTSIQAAVAGGIQAFGDRMGGLGEQMAKMMVESLADIADGPAPGDDALQARATKLVGETLARGARVPGFGIPLHGADPRAPKVLEIARKQGVHGLYCRFGEAMGRALAAARGGRAVPMNLDGVGALVILDLGFSWRSTRMFLLTPRSISMGTHFLEEQEQDNTWRHIPAEQIDYQE
ncbi:MAG: citrate/2-methylcitrate synthase [Alphaproteobacteria bacterium]